MGNSASADEDEFDKFDGIETLGYRVLGVQPNSPASVAGLVSFFDFLVGANGKMLLGSGEGLKEGDEYDDVDLPGLLQDHIGKKLELLVYNIKSQETRLATLIPSDSWGGAGLLGVTIRLDNYGGADERLIRILSVEHNSPAAIAGLVPLQDYLLGTVSESLEDTSQLANLIANHRDQVIEFYVYNTDSDVVRVVALMPTWNWGGGGLLGAEVGTGYLHRLPRASRQSSGTSVERKVKYVEKSTPSAPTNVCVEPTLELETVDGQPGEHATPQQVADSSNTDRVTQEEKKQEPSELTTEVAGNGDGVSLNQKQNTAEETQEKRPSDAELLFSGPPPSGI